MPRINAFSSNQTFCEMMELSPAEALGDGWVRRCIMTIWTVFARASRAVGGELGLFRAEYRYVCPSGRQGWVEEQTRPALGPGGELLGYVGTLAEVTARKIEERARAVHREELEARVRERTAER